MSGKKETTPTGERIPDMFKKTGDPKSPEQAFLSSPFLVQMYFGGAAAGAAVVSLLNVVVKW